ncbi:MAG: pyridoxal phosphate-dependent aminotransferase [Gaiellaceae bacterium]
MTDWSSLVVPALSELDPFALGETVSNVQARHGLEEVVKLNWNENLFGPLPGVVEAVRDELENISMYPEQVNIGFREDVARYVGTEPAWIVPGHGTLALIGSLASAFLRPGDHAVVPALTYGLYAQMSAVRGATIERVPMPDLALDLDAMARAARETNARIVWICDPNNPTASVVDAVEWERFLEALPDACVAVVDEAYIDYLPVSRRVRRELDVENGRPVVLLRSFSKFFGLAGLRLGYAIVDEALASYLDIVDEPFNVNCAGLAAGRACLRATDAADRRRGEVAEAREALARGLRQAGAVPLPSAANFVLARVDVDDAALADRLAARGLLIRPGSDFGLPGYVRITVGPTPLMDRVVAEVREVCETLRG